MALTTIDDRGLKTPIDLLDNEKIRFGTGNDLEFYHNGTDSGIVNNTGGLYIQNDGTVFIGDVGGNEFSAKFIDNGAVELYHNNDKRLSTWSDGINIYGDEGEDALLHLFADDGDDDVDKWRIRSSIYGSGHFQFYDGSNWDDSLKAVNGGTTELHYDGSKKLETGSGGISVTGGINLTTNLSLLDNGIAKFGTGDDLQIYHDGTNSRVFNSTGSLITRTTGSFLVQNYAGNEVLIDAIVDGAVSLYYDNSNKLQTESNGVRINGILKTNVTSGQALSYGDNAQIHLGSGDDLKIYHDGTSNLIRNMGSVDMYINLNETEVAAKFTANGNVELYHDNTKKFETTSTGIQIYQTSTDASTGVIQFNDTAGRQNTIGQHFATNAYDSRIEFGISDGSTSGGTNRVASISYAGISFGSDTASANRLDDYEEGTWTPSWKGNTNHGTTAYSTNTATYTKIGNLVRVGGYTQISGNSGGSGAWIIDNLPFANPNELSKLTTGSCMMEANQDNDGLWLVPYKNANSSQIFFYYTRDDASWFTFDLSDDTTFNIIWGITYQV